MSYIVRQIDLEIQIGQGIFGETGSNSVKLTGLRVMTAINKAGPPAMNEALIRVFGMELSLMNQLSTLGLVLQQRRNVVIISAGDATNGMSVVFQGTIQDAYADFAGMPEVSFNMRANGGLLAAIQPTKPSSFTGAADVGTIMSGLAVQGGFTFENNGVQEQLSNPYFPGTVRQQIMACAKAANIGWTIDDNTLAIWPIGGSRGGSIPLLSPETGMVGYPMYSVLGPIIQALFNPAVSFGGQVKVQSSVTPACGVWHVYGLDYELASQTPDGPWYMTVKCIRAGAS
jgi:hypothetical protein